MRNHQNTNWSLIQPGPNSVSWWAQEHCWQRNRDSERAKVWGRKAGELSLEGTLKKETPHMSGLLKKNNKDLKSLWFPPPSVQRLIGKGVCFPLPAAHNPVLSKPRQAFSFFFSAYHNFYYSMSMITALRGASLTPTTRIHLLWQQGKREQGTNIFHKSIRIGSLHMEILKIQILFFLPAFQNSQFSLLMILSMSLHQTTTLPHFL